MTKRSTYRFVTESIGLPTSHMSRASIDDASIVCNGTGSGDRIRLLVFTSLYPDAVRPRHGVFVEERLRHLVASGRVTATVVAPVPWFPFRHQRFGGYATFARVPWHEERHGISILHPRFPVIPKVGMSITPWLMYRALLPVIRNLKARGTQFDLIDAHYLYPDGVSAVRLGESLGKPVVVTARGSDVNVIAQYRRPMLQILQAAERAAAIVTVSEALKSRLHGIGVHSGKITTLRNGVDLDRFHAMDCRSMRTRMALSGHVWLAVGNLVELKGVHLTIAALAKTSDVTLLIAGKGPEENRLRILADALGVSARVHFLGNVPQMQLPEYYNVADALILASSHEGMPNVVLESLACGTPVVAAPFESAAELLSLPEAGEIAMERSAEELSCAWQRLKGRMPSRTDTCRYARRFGWKPVVEAQCALYAKVLAAVKQQDKVRDHE